MNDELKDAQSGIASDKENPIRLLRFEELDEEIMSKNRRPMVMLDLMDREETVLVSKYTEISQELWGHYRSHPEAAGLIYVSNISFKVIDNINSYFLNADGLQVLGALTEMSNEIKIAQQFFAEASATESPMAHLNAAIFWYRLGNRTVMNNYTLAQRMLTKARARLAELRLSPTEQYDLVRVCDKLQGEIDYHLSPFLLKLIRAIIRLLTFSFNPEIHYVGPASPQKTNPDSIRELRKLVGEREMELKRKAAEERLHEISLSIPPTNDSLRETLEKTSKSIKAAPDDKELHYQTLVLADVDRQVREARRLEEEQRQEELARHEFTVLKNLTKEELAKIEEMEQKFADKPEHELVQMARILECRKNEFDKTILLWMLQRRRHMQEVMMTLRRNSTIPDDILEELKQIRL